MTYTSPLNSSLVITAVMQTGVEIRAQYPGIYGLARIILSDLPQLPLKNDRVTTSGIDGWLDGDYIVENWEREALDDATLFLRRVVQA